ncbi:unnamed protein product [Hymenolepis diminuta]|uniref:PA2c domain-containing protein n=1 Tax=Hymenolepis diminuta TaxID=6216 RepID=A0A0R3S9K7_HYMDI|nr:unnamed protein product [Hymenolepis diminuta]
MYDNNADSNGSDDGFDSVPPAKRQKPTTCLSITTLTFNIIYLMMPSVKKQYFYLVNMVTGDSSAPKILHLRAELAKWYEENDCCGYDGPLDFQNPQDICCTFAFDCNLDGYSVSILGCVIFPKISFIVLIKFPY